MKELGKTDSFKDRIKNKMDDSPVYKDSEDALWSKVIGDIEENEAKEKPIFIKIRPLTWYASAAVIVLGLFVSLLYLKEKPNTEVLANNKPQKKKTTHIIEDKKT